MSQGENKVLLELSIVIPTKDRNFILKRHMKQLVAAAKGKRIELIVVNDSSCEISGITEGEHLRVVSNPKNGVASARNYGASLAMSRLIMFVDDDMMVFKENIDAVLQFHSTNSGCFLNLNWTYPPIVDEVLLKTPFGRYLTRYGFNSLKGWNRDNENWNDHETFETNGITSQNLSVEKATFFNCGGYNEDFPHAGYEDHEFSRRIKQYGCKIYIDPRQVTYHDESDRLDIGNWLARKYRGGITRRMAVQKGIVQSSLQLTVAKRIMLSVGDKFLYSIARFCNSSLFWEKLDNIYFRIVNVLLATAIYGGYFSKEAEKLIRQVDD